MKKYILVLLIVLSFVSCVKDNENNKSPVERHSNVTFVESGMKYSVISGSGIINVTKDSLEVEMLKLTVKYMK